MSSNNPNHNLNRNRRQTQSRPTHQEPPPIRVYRDGDDLPIHVAADLRKYWLQYNGNLGQLQRKIAEKHCLLIEHEELLKVLFLYYQAALGTEEWAWDVGRAEEKRLPSRAASEPKRPSEDRIHRQSHKEIQRRQDTAFPSSSSSQATGTKKSSPNPILVDTLLSHLRKSGKYEEVTILEDLFLQIAMEEDTELKEKSREDSGSSGEHKLLEKRSSYREEWGNDYKVEAGERDTEWGFIHAAKPGIAGQGREADDKREGRGEYRQAIVSTNRSPEHVISGLPRTSSGLRKKEGLPNLRK